MNFLLEDIQGLTCDSDDYKYLHTAGIQDIRDLAKIDPVTGQKLPSIIRGMKGEYFAKKDLTNLVLRRIDVTIDFNWKKQSPDPTLPKNNFSVEWNGYFLAPETGSFTFFTKSDDGVRLFIDEKIIIENWTNHGKTVDSGTISLEKGTYYPLKLQYYDNEGSSIIQLSFKTPNIKKTIIPADMLWQEKPITPLNISFLDLLRYVSAAQNILVSSNNIHTLLKRTPCPVCNGDGWVTTILREKCGHCNGTGKIEFIDTDICYICKGEGQIISKSFIKSCSTCKGTGHLSDGSICPSCVGEGCQKIDEKEECWSCNGKGTLSDNRFIKCAPCRGDGIILTRDTLQKCTACQGAGMVDIINPFSKLTAFDLFTLSTDDLEKKTKASPAHIELIKETISTLVAFVDDKTLSRFKLED